MRLYLISSALLLGACMRNEPEVVPLPPAVPADLLQPCAGYTGPVPRTEGMVADALLAEARGRACANAKLRAVGEVLGG